MTTMRFDPDETVLMVLRRHWFALLPRLGVFLAFLLAPPAALLLLTAAAPTLAERILTPIAFFFLALYLAAMLTWAFLLWMSYYLDAWVITDRRIIDIEQHGLWHREIQEITLDRIQNVRMEIPGFAATFLGFGDIRVETAGEGVLLIQTVPHLEEAKHLILKYSQQQYAKSEIPVPSGVEGRISKSETDGLPSS